MMHKLVFILFFSLTPFIGNAVTTVKSLPSIFENVGVVDTLDLVNIVKENLYEYDLSDNLQIKLRSHDNVLRLKSKHNNYQVSIVDLDVKKNSRRFEAKLAFEADSYYEVVSLKGRYSEMVTIPVLSHKIPHNVVIRSSDIDYIEYEKHKMRHDTVADASLLIGNVLKHSKRAMSPIRKRDVVREKIVQKNKEVELIYQTPFITLRASGYTLDAGAKGDYVRVRNSQSNKIVRAYVKDSGSAIVKSEKL